MTKKERIEQLRIENEPYYGSGTTPYIAGDDEGYQRGIVEGYELGYDEAIDKACEWLHLNLPNIEYTIKEPKPLRVSRGLLIDELKKAMDK